MTHELVHYDYDGNITGVEDVGGPENVVARCPYCDPSDDAGKASFEKIDCERCDENIFRAAVAVECDHFVCCHYSISNFGDGGVIDRSLNDENAFYLADALGADARLSERLEHELLLNARVGLIADIKSPHGVVQFRTVALGKCEMVLRRGWYAAFEGEGAVLFAEHRDEFMKELRSK